MPDFLSKQEKSPSVEIGVLERDSLEITELRKRIAELESKARMGEGIVNETEQKQEVRREIKKYLEEAQRTSSSAPIATRDEIREIQRMEPNQQIGALVSLAFEKDLKTAIQVAKDTDNPAILDEFHDTLVDHYYRTLLNKGILKEI